MKPLVSALRAKLGSQGVSINTAEDLATGEQKLKEMPVAILITDMWLPEIKGREETPDAGLQLVHMSKKKNPAPACIIMTSNPSAAVLNYCNTSGTPLIKKDSEMKHVDSICEKVRELLQQPSSPKQAKTAENN
jgi:DNA-binding NtrC family response regulator